MARKSEVDRAILEAALEGLQHRLDAINEKMTEVRGLLSGRAKATPAAEPAGERPVRRRKMSAAARKRIAEAQRRRWQQFRANQKGGARRSKAAAAKAAAEEPAE